MLTVEEMRRDLEAKGHRIVKNTMSDEELDYYENHDFGKEFEEGIKDGSAIVSEGPWEETVAAIKARNARNERKMTSLRVPVWILEGLKRNAERGGVKFSEYAIEALAKAAV